MEETVGLVWSGFGADLWKDSIVENISNLCLLQSVPHKEVFLKYRSDHVAFQPRNLR